MTDYEFALLQKEIQDTQAYLYRLQQEHIRQTGKRYTPGGPGIRVEEAQYERAY